MADRQQEIAQERQDYPDTEHAKRLLPTFDERIEHWPFQSFPVFRKKACHEQREDDEMQQPIWSQVRFVVGMEGVVEPVGNELSQVLKTLRQRQNESKEE